MTSYFTDALFQEVVEDIMAKEGISEADAQKMLYTGGFTIEATVNTKLQSQMENLMLNTNDAYFPAGWHEEEVTSISDDDVQVMNEDGTPKTRVAEDGTVYYYRNVRTQAAMVTLDYDGNVVAIVGGLGEKTKSLSLNRAYSVERQTGSTIKPIGAYALGVEYGLVNWSTMLNNSPLYQKQDMVIRDEDYCRKNGLMGLSDKQLRAYPNAWRSWPRNYGGNYGDNSDVPLWNGLARSLNTIAVRVGDLVGASNIFNFLYNTLQLTTLDPTNDVGLAQMVMGSQTKGVTPMTLAAAFQIFYDGEYTTPHLYTRVLDRDGNIYLENNATSYQALTSDTAYVMNRLLKNVLYSSVGTASGRYPKSNGMEAFGKTGTASDEKDLWFVGGTPYYVTAVWWGYDAPYDMTKTLTKQQANPYLRHGLEGPDGTGAGRPAVQGLPGLVRGGGAPLLHPERPAGRQLLPQYGSGLLPCRRPARHLHLLARCLHAGSGSGGPGRRSSPADCHPHRYKQPRYRLICAPSVDEEQQKSHFCVPGAAIPARKNGTSRVKTG